eukprot:930881-Rhodomonas_salina.2
MLRVRKRPQCVQCSGGMDCPKMCSMHMLCLQNIRFSLLLLLLSFPPCPNPQFLPGLQQDPRHVCHPRRRGIIPPIVLRIGDAMSGTDKDSATFRASSFLRSGSSTKRKVPRALL